jgi:hypothetical protein
MEAAGGVIWLLRFVSAGSGTLGTNARWQRPRITPRTPQQGNPNDSHEGRSRRRGGHRSSRCAWSAMSGARRRRPGSQTAGSVRRVRPAASTTPLRTSSDDADSPVGHPRHVLDLWCGVASSARPGFSSCPCWSRSAPLDLLPAGLLRLVLAHSRDGAPCSGRRPARPRPSGRRTS